MSKRPIDYRGVTRGDGAGPRVRWQTVVSCSLLGMGLACGVGALVWPQRRHELVGAAISLSVTGVLVYFPYVRT